MKERPILFSAPMVRAILEERKTETRRVMKPQPFLAMLTDSKGRKAEHWCIDYEDEKKRSAWLPNEAPYWTHSHYGVPGDCLWVRETWASYGMEALPLPERPIFYRADDDKREGHYTPPDLKWTPSIHMPRWASRITLEITKIRVERIQDCSEADAKAEGAGISLPDHPGWDGDPDCYRKLFRERWDTLNKKRGFGWEKNPWVWVLEFKRIGG